MSYVENKNSFGVKKQLAQVSLTAVAQTIYSPPANTETEIVAIYFCNIGGQTRSFSMWLDDDGNTNTDATKLFEDIDIARSETLVIDTPIYMNNENGELIMNRDGGPGGITVTVFGIETDLN